MNDLLLKATHSTPRIEFFATGDLSIGGSIYPEDAKEYFHPLMEWVMNLRIKKVNFIMRIDYLNSTCAKKLFELLKRLRNNKYIDTINIKWYYQKDDEDGLETGQLLSESLPEIHFDLLEYEKKN